jgi:hypothetical protein
LCIQADVSALGKTNGFLGVCLSCAALCIQVDVSALGKFGFLAFCLQVKLRGKNFYLHSFSWEVIDIF